jgi:MSHA pilin protein MshA
MRLKQQGFTLVELVVVIVVLGILAAIAIPRYANYTREARTAALNGLAGAIRSSVGLVQARYVAAGTGTSPVTLADGTTVAVTTGAAGGIPTVAAAGIEAAVNQTGFVFVPATGVWNLPTAIANCNVTYDAAGTATVDGSNC